MNDTKKLTEAAEIVRDLCKKQDCGECPYGFINGDVMGCRLTDGCVPADWLLPAENKAADEVQPPTEQELYAALRTIKRQCTAMLDCELGCEYCALRYGEGECFATDLGLPKDWGMRERRPDGTYTKLV